MKKLILATAFLVLAPILRAGELAGVFVKDQVTAEDGQILVLNGMGLREKLWIDIYVGSLYLVNKSNNVTEILSAPHAMRIQMDFVYKKVAKKKLLKAWRDGFEKNPSKEACYGGAFMESSSSSTSHPSRFIKEDDIMYPCNILDEKYLSTCYKYQSTHFAKISSYNWIKVGELCSMVPKQYQEGCFTFIGSNQVGSYIEPEKFIETCNSFEETNYRTGCYRGVLFGLAGRYKAEPERMKKFCDLMADTDKPQCFRIMGAMTKQWTNNPSDYECVCESLQQYSTECLIGLNSRGTEPPIIIKNV